MNDDDKYLFDLQGFLVIKGVLGAGEVALNRGRELRDLDPSGEKGCCSLLVGVVGR